MKKYLGLITLLICLNVSTVYAQEQIIDEVVAVVGANFVLQSDIEAQYLQIRAQGDIEDAGALRCRIFEDLLFQKLMLNQGEIDSVMITDEQVNQTMDARFRYYIQQFGSQEKLEQYYKKSLIEIKEEFRTLVKEQLIVEEVQQKIVQDAKVTPSEVRRLFNELPKDSVPMIDAEFELGMINKDLVISKDELEVTRERLKALRERIVKGENFNALAVLYSEDPGTARKGGELGFVSRGQLYPEYEATAFGLKQGEISEVIKTQAGYHIIQLIERRGERINTRHILLMPKVPDAEITLKSKLLDSIAGLIRTNNLTFEEAALKYSDDPSRVGGGLLINPNTGNARFTATQLTQLAAQYRNLYQKAEAAASKLNVGEVSEPFLYQDEEGKQKAAILYLKLRTQEHRASLKEDYNTIQEWALNKKKGETVDNWITDKISKTYFRISPAYTDCNFIHSWEIK